ncbi:hypothetical protein BDF21DRAFT_419824, partial [Thamnidium elegans]
CATNINDNFSCFKVLKKKAIKIIPYTKRVLQYNTFITAVCLAESFIINHFWKRLPLARKSH